MDRRRAIGSIMLLGAGAAGSLTAWRRLTRPGVPELRRLDAHLGLIAALADTIIPTTDTPGAIEAGVPAFIVMMVRDATDRRSQRNFLEGLDAVEALCVQRFGHPFASCSGEQRGEVLRWWQAAARQPAWLERLAGLWTGRPFYDVLRDYTVVGYCTSMAGATRALAYDFIPGPPFQGCVPLLPGQRAWATF